jgi:hypothetical protein
MYTKRIQKGLAVFNLGPILGVEIQSTPLTLQLLPLICLSLIVFMAAAWWFLTVTWRLSIIITLLEKQNELIKNQANGK